MIFGWAVKKEAGTKHTQMLLLLQIFYGIGPTSEGEKQSTLHDPRLKKKQPTMNGEKTLQIEFETFHVLTVVVCTHQPRLYSPAVAPVGNKANRYDKLSGNIHSS